MPQIPTTYTGLNSGAAPIYTGTETERAMERSVDRTLGRQRQLEQDRQAGEKEFIDALSVDTISMASEEVMKKQADLAEAYINDWSKVYQEKGGTLSMQDKARMAADKQKIVAQQGQWKAGHQRYLQETQAFNPQRHDKDEYQLRVSKYLQTGEVPAEGFLVTKAADMSDYLAGLTAISKSKEWSSDAKVEGGSVVTRKKSPFTEEEARGFYTQYVLGEDSMWKNVAQRFSQLKQTSPSTYMEYLLEFDEDDDQMLDDAERENAILKYGFDTDARPRLLADRVESKPYRETRWQADTSQSKEDEARATGRGEGRTKGTEFKVTGGLSSTYLGQGIEGINFGYSDDVRDSWGIQIPVGVIEDKPENVKLQGSYVMARPVVAAEGKIEWVAYTGKQKEITASQYRSNYGKEGYIKVNDPRSGEPAYYKIDNVKTEPITTLFGTTSGILETNFPGFRDVAKSRGLAGSGKIVL